MIRVCRSVSVVCWLAALGCAKPAAQTSTPSAGQPIAHAQGIIGLQQTPEPRAAGLAGWAVVADTRSLVRHVDQAAEKGVPVIVHITAKWCAECLALEKNVLGSERVAMELASMSRLLVDVTSVSDESQQLLAIFAVSGLPAILFYDDVVPLAGYLMAPQKVPRPEATASILEPVSADELMHRLRKSR